MSRGKFMAFVGIATDPEETFINHTEILGAAFRFIDMDTQTVDNTSELFLNRDSLTSLADYARALSTTKSFNSNVSDIPDKSRKIHLVKSGTTILPIPAAWDPNKGWLKQNFDLMTNDVLMAQSQVLIAAKQALDRENDYKRHWFRRLLNALPTYSN